MVHTGVPLYHGLGLGVVPDFKLGICMYDAVDFHLTSIVV